MNPFDDIYTGNSGLNGLEGLDGFKSRFKKFRKKLKKRIRKIGKVVAPIVVGVVAGPAAGAAVAKGILEARKAKKAAKAEARSLGVSWNTYKKGENAIMNEIAAKTATQIKNPAAKSVIKKTLVEIDKIESSPQVKEVISQLKQQGLTDKQIDKKFVESRIVKDAVNNAVSISTYDKYIKAGYRPEQVASTAIIAGEKAESGVNGDISKYIPIAISAGLLLLSR